MKTAANAKLFKLNHEIQGAQTVRDQFFFHWIYNELCSQSVLSLCNKIYDL